MATPFLVGGTSGATSTPVQVAGPCKVLGYDIYNGSAAAAWVSFYDTALAPTVGTTVPIYQVGLGTLTKSVQGITDPGGLFFKNGLWVAATTSAAGSGNPGVAATVSLGIS